MRVGIRFMKLDQEFFSAEIINLLESEKIPFMTPAVKTKGVNSVERDIRYPVIRRNVRDQIGST